MDVLDDEHGVQAYRVVREEVNHVLDDVVAVAALLVYPVASDAVEVDGQEAQVVDMHVDVLDTFDGEEVAMADDPSDQRVQDDLEASAVHPVVN